MRLNKAAKQLFLSFSKRSVDHEVHFDGVDCALYQSELLYWRGIHDCIMMDYWPILFTRGQTYHVPDSTQYSGQNLQSSAARAGWAHFGIVTNIIANQRHCKVVQRGYDNPASFSDIAWIVIVVEDLNHNSLVLHMIMLV